MKSYNQPQTDILLVTAHSLMEASAPFVEFGDGGAIIPSGDIINQGR